MILHSLLFTDAKIPALNAKSPIYLKQNVCP